MATLVSITIETVYKLSPNGGFLQRRIFIIIIPLNNDYIIILKGSHDFLYPMAQLFTPTNKESSLTLVTQAVRPGFSFRLSFFFPRSVTNRRLASRAHALLVQRTARIFYRSCRRVKS